ncbi:MAG TPA: oxidoreductase [Intrasporangiaceae bacterium]|nr:oxidoreductase [Intrasporangiaceae bacterium]
MAWWRFGARKKGRSTEGSVPEGGRSRRQEVLSHFREFERTRVGVEAYIEPATHVTSTTMVLIDFQGEWTRRAVPDPAAGIALAKDLGIPVFDTNLTGYPQRMRDWNARQRRDRDRRRAQE